MKRLGLLLFVVALMIACSGDSSVPADGVNPNASADAGGHEGSNDSGVMPGAGADADDTTDSSPEPDAADAAADVDDSDAVDSGDADESDIAPDGGPGPEPEPEVRSRRRMDIIQLDRSIRVVTGGIGWTDVAGGNGPSLFDALASTLGVPDFIDRTREDLSPSLLFHKFMSDAARSVCTVWVEQETNPRTAVGTFFAPGFAPEDTLETNLTGVFETLQRLLLRAHGHRYALDAPELQPWANAFDEVVDATGETWRGWRAVCIAAFVHPDFYSY